jgi:hypothetical protein
VELLKHALAGCDLPLLWDFELWMRLNPEDQELGMTDFGAVILDIRGTAMIRGDLRVWLATVPPSASRPCSSGTRR